MNQTYIITRKGFGYRINVQKNGQTSECSAKDFAELLRVIAIQALGYQNPEVTTMIAEDHHELRDCHGRLIIEGRPNELSEMLEEIIRPADVILRYTAPTTKMGRVSAWFADNF